ncbi:MAG: tyrosine-type recombinase/integrase [Lachnospiraceae bacterium]|nr:tyrosine-type recombinase/integrase [Lachnospiraceae bacterium]
MSDYKKEKNYKVRQQANEIIARMPPYVRDYFLEREIRLSAMSIYSYAGQLMTFFTFLHDSSPYFGKKDIKEISLEDLDQLNDRDIVEFMHYLRNYPVKSESGKVKYVECSPTTIQHYTVALNTFWKYLYVRKMVSSNPIELITRAKLPKKEVIYLDREDKNQFLDAVETGDGLTKKQAQFHEKNGKRDMAIVNVFLSTGIRVSELVGMDLKDINFKRHSINVYRKGGNFDTVYFSDTAEAYLKDYLEVREDTYKPLKDETAVFLNKSGKRLSVRSVELMVKKYINASIPSEADRITPHKLRSTYAETMLKATGGDLERVQKLMGHSSITSTTHYVASTEEEKASVRNLSEKF